MPIYEYRCECGFIHEALKSMDEKYDLCKCGKMAQRIMSVPAPAIIPMFVHTDSGIPMDVHNKLEDKNRDQFQYLQSQQGKKILPEDM